MRRNSEWAAPPVQSCSRAAIIQMIRWC